MNKVLTMAALALLAGCAAYSWRSQVPAELRTVAVTTFRNDSDVTELGAIAARELAREFQREGTFTLASRDDAAIEVQGEIGSVFRSESPFGDRSINRRRNDYDFHLKARISVIDRRAGKVLVDSRSYEATTTFVSDGDLLTAERNASGRLAADLAQQVVDDVVGAEWNVTSSTDGVSETEEEK